MSFNSAAFLADREAIANGLDLYQDHRSSRPVKISKSWGDKNRWIASLTPKQREQLRQEWEYEQSKKQYQQ